MNDEWEENHGNGLHPYHHGRSILDEQFHSYLRWSIHFEGKLSFLRRIPNSLDRGRQVWDCEAGQKSMTSSLGVGSNAISNQEPLILSLSHVWRSLFILFCSTINIIWKKSTRLLRFSSRQLRTFPRWHAWLLPPSDLAAEISVTANDGKTNVI